MADRPLGMAHVSDTALRRLAASIPPAKPVYGEGTMPGFQRSRLDVLEREPPPVAGPFRQLADAVARQAQFQPVPDFSRPAR